MDFILETERLFIREIKDEDFQNLKSLLGNIEVMYAWEHSFSNLEIKEWIKKNKLRFIQDGISYFSVFNKSNNIFLGQVGLFYTQINNKRVLELGYIIKKDFWGKNYAYEASEKLIHFAFESLKVNEIFAIIRPENEKSIKLANKLGFIKKANFVKNYQNKEMIHDIYIKINS